MSKMMTAILATTALNAERIILSAHVISELLDKQPRLPVKVNFYGEAIGVTKKFYVKELASVFCDIELYNEPLMTRNGGNRILDVYPSFKILEEKTESNLRIVMSAEFNEVSICPMPAATAMFMIDGEDDDN